MSRRERFLATIVGLLIVLVAGFFVTEKVRRAFRQRALARTQVLGELDRKQTIIDHAARAARNLADYEEMSLPSDPELARSQYQAWLSEIVDRSGIKEPHVKVVSQSRIANDCTLLSCSLVGRGDFRQLTKLLHEFYSVNTIHRIRRLPLRPIPDSKDMKIDLRLEALILATSQRHKTFNSAPLSELAKLPIEQVIDPIVQRNLFSPENRFPEFDVVKHRTIERGKTFSLTLDASDPDPLDKLSFELIDGPPEGMRLDHQAGRFDWIPRKVGEFTVTIAVHDDGIPIRTTRREIAITVVEPPPAVVEQETASPKKLEFDDARYTYAIAMLEVAGERQLWLQVRTSGEILKLAEGDPVRVGSIDATVGRIGERDVVLDANGETIRIQVGEPLVGGIGH